MTEQEWLQATDPRLMLKFLQGKASDRKLRLFAVACCRRNWHLLTDERSRIAVEVAERLADGLAIEQERETAEHAANEASHAAVLSRGASEFTTSEQFTIAARAAGFTVGNLIDTEAGLAIVACSSLIARHESVSPSRQEAENTSSSSSLRDIIGNPFRPITLDPAWLTWHDGLLVSMDQKMYDSRDFSDISILADALEEAGCDNSDILAHCRQPGEHVRGCWLVDLILGKE